MVKPPVTYKKKPGNSKPKPPKKDHPWKTGYIAVHLRITTTGNKDLNLPKKMKIITKKKDEHVFRLYKGNIK